MEYKWYRTNVEKLIELVQENACLYNIRSQEYMDRTKKAHVFNEIQKILEQDMAGVTLEDIKKKWKNLRTQYLREIRLIKNSKKSGSGRSDLYTPKLWCFDQLSFLETHCATRGSEDNIDMGSMDVLPSSSACSSTEENHCAREEPDGKRRKKTNQFAEMRRELSIFKEKIAKKKVEQEFAWLGTLVTTQMDNIASEHKQKAAWEIQTVVQKYIAMTQQQLAASTSRDEGAKDLLEMSMDGIFDDSDFET